MKFRTVASAKVVYVPLGKNEDDEPTRFARTGIRVNMADNSWWFLSFRSKSWTNHWVGLESNSNFLSPSTQVDRKQSYTPAALRREYSERCPMMLVALQLGEQLALAEEAAKRGR